jgi:hypothetical protein
MARAERPFARPIQLGAMESARQPCIAIVSIIS